ncbi:MAG: 16S rRNA (cytosine(1402)-N(4))-methyltransferase RsmH [Gammaproteobacteria bacterium]|nr:16S rRNA (cytosine(1402)-N(4))-methyltransferase RsmH [Gammaproteobacteria bacterium]
MPHTPVLLDEIVSAVTTDVSGRYVDATYGGGGHSRALLGGLRPEARLLAMDRDDEAVAQARSLAKVDSRVAVECASFSHINEVTRRRGFQPITGVMMDIGISGYQLEDPDRGFSYMRDGPLDMRMDRKQGVTAAQWLNSAEEEDLAEVFRRYGEDHHAARIARAVVRRRPLARTLDLVSAIREGATGERVVRERVMGRQLHRQTLARVFQAVRMHVNDEVDQLDEGLNAAFECLDLGGRLGVISFHSIEHRMVRRRFRAWVQGDPVLRRVSIPGEPGGGARHILRNGRPSGAEIAANPRAKSAMLQVVEKCA